MKTDIYQVNCTGQQIAVLDLDGHTLAKLNRDGKAFVLAKGPQPQHVDDGMVEHAPPGLPIIKLHRTKAYGDLARVRAEPEPLVRYLAALQVQREREQQANLAASVEAFEALAEARREVNVLWNAWARSGRK